MNHVDEKSEALKTIVEPSTKVANQSTDVVQFVPTPHMLVWLDTAIRTEAESPTEIAAACEPKVDRTNWYKWLELPGFIEWYRGEWDRRLRAHGPRLDVIGLKNARRDHKFWESMQKRVGNLTEGKGVSITGDKVIAILGDMKAE